MNVTNFFFNRPIRYIPSKKPEKRFTIEDLIEKGIIDPEKDQLDFLVSLLREAEALTLIVTRRMLSIPKGASLVRQLQNAGLKISEQAAAKLNNDEKVLLRKYCFLD